MKKTSAEKLYDLCSYGFLGVATKYSEKMHQHLTGDKFNEKIFLSQTNKYKNPNVLSPILKRKSCRKFINNSVCKEVLSKIIFLAYSLKDVHGSFTVPLAGSLNVMSLRVLVKGKMGWSVQSWNPAQYTFSRVLNIISDPRKLFFAKSSDIDAAGAVIIISANLGVLASRYSFRAYKFACIQAGHIAQNILLAAAEIGLGSLPLGSLKEEEIITTCKLLDEKPLYAVVLSG